MQCGICDSSGLVLCYIIFSFGNNYYPDNSILRTTVMDRTDTSINYIFRSEETVGMLMGNKLWAL